MIRFQNLSKIFTQTFRSLILDLDGNKTLVQQTHSIVINSCIYRYIGQSLRINCVFHDVIEGQMTEVKEIGRTQLLDDLRNRRINWGAKGGS